MVTRMVSEVTVNTDILDDSRYRLMFSVEEVNRLTLEGMPFRDAYKKVGLDIEKGEFEPDYNLSHTHEGSIGNLCNDRITELYDGILRSFDFEKFHTAFAQLLGRK